METSSLAWLSAFMAPLSALYRLSVLCANPGHLIWTRRPRYIIVYMHKVLYCLPHPQYVPPHQLEHALIRPSYHPMDPQGPRQAHDQHHLHHLWKPAHSTTPCASDTPPVPATLATSPTRAHNPLITIGRPAVAQCMGGTQTRTTTHPPPTPAQQPATKCTVRRPRNKPNNDAVKSTLPPSPQPNPQGPSAPE